VQKTRNRSEASPSHNRHRSVVAQPEVVSSDVLGTMLDEDLIVRLRALEDDKGRVYEAYGDARPWEEEIAYIRREQQMRRVRRDTHADYMKKEADEFNRAEFGLPAGDFDNSVFVYAAQGGRTPRWN
jgi:hypothetical protein